MHKNINLTILLCVFFLLSNLSFSQNEKFRHFGIPEGLPQETITCMTKDSLGFLWIGTQEGIVRFDGIRFSSIVNRNKDVQIEGEKITNILLGNNNTLWIGTAQSGLFYYNYKAQELRQIGSNNIKVTGITLDSSGNVFVSFLNNGIYKISPNNSAYIIKKIEIKERYIIDLIYFKNNIIYTTSQGEVFFFNPNQIKNITPQKVMVPQNTNTIKKLVLMDYSVWLCTKNGLYKITQDLLKIKQIGFLKYSVYDIVKFNKFYFLATNKGLLKIKENDSGFDIIHKYISKEKYDINAPNGNMINDLIINDDLLFVGGITLDITQFSKNKAIELVSNKLNIGYPSVFSFFKYKQYLFIGTVNGLIVYDSVKEEYTKISAINNRVNDLDLDDNNNLWITTLDKIYVCSLNDFSISNPIFNTFSLENNVYNRNSFKDNNDTMWITTQGDGMYRFTGNISQKKFTFTKYEATSDTNKLPSDFILGINQDYQGNYWISTQTGLCKLTFEGKSYTNPKTKTYFKGDNGLLNHGVLSTFLDSKKNLWIATRNGLHKYNHKNDNFSYYGKKQGLSNAFIYNIVEDNNNNLWLSTNGGLFKFNKTSAVFSNYTPKDGLQSLEFNLGAAYKDTIDGKLYFGGIGGYNIINPVEIDSIDTEKDLIFTRFKIKNNEATPNSAIDYLQHNISFAKTVEIKYNDFPVFLEFSALDFSPNSNIKYAYKLLPDDEQWNTLDDKNFIQLLNLSPKNYTLQIKGMSRGKLWKKPPLELQINVKPPWYKSNLAYLLYLVLFLSIIYFYYKITLQKKIAHQESLRLKEINDLKTKFITNITHEFRTPLTIILGYLNNLKEKIPHKQETIKAIEVVEKNSSNLLSLVNQMLDLAKLEKGGLDLNQIQNDIICYLNYILNSFSSLADENKITLLFQSKIEQLSMDFDPEKIRQIFTNLLSNAIKFSQENTKITLHIEKNENTIEISVCDQGIGIDKEDLPHIFDRFYQVNKSGFKVFQGTGIGLALTKELVELMQGTITVTSEIKKGTTFKVFLPITQNAVKKNIDKPKTLPPTKNITVPESKNKTHPKDTNTILIVEDNKDMSRYITSCLNNNFKIINAFNGKEGWEIALEKIPDIIITDVMMPKMDGYELTKKLQNNELTNHIPVIILTSKAMEGDKIEGLQSGADVYLAKPFSKKELLIRIKNLITKRANLQEYYQSHTIKKKIIEHDILPPDKNIEFLNKSIELIHKNIDNPDFNAPELAKELLMSKSQLYRKLKAISNTSTAVFIRKVRLEKAKELLKTSNQTITEIAYSTGFNDPNWFSRIFKKEFGVSPTKIRK